MNVLIPISYGRKTYPNGITPKITEVAGHFDKINIPEISNYSLHTEYSFGPRKLNNIILSSTNSSIITRTKSKVPLLWYDKTWSIDFYNFLVKLIGDNPPPDILEIHPPFKSYCDSFDKFMEIYSPFEELFLKMYPNCKILIENRSGNRCGEKFLFSGYEDYYDFSNLLDKHPSSLKLILDVPQVFTAYKLTPNNFNDINMIFATLKDVRHNISSIHLWGKSNTGVAHVGDLNSYFKNNMNFKNQFLELLYDCFDDSIPRFLVPEVNGSQNDFDSIINDLINNNFTFI